MAESFNRKCLRLNNCIDISFLLLENFDEYRKERKTVYVVTSNKLQDIRVGVLKLLGQVLYGICCDPHSGYSDTNAGSRCNKQMYPVGLSNTRQEMNP
jgi:hypothetical protein